MQNLLVKITPLARTGRPRIDPRRVFNGIYYRMRTGCQWHMLPEKYPSGSTCHIIPRPIILQHLCLDKGYSGRPMRNLAENAGYIAHIRQIGEEHRTCRHTPRRWVVERTLAWFNCYRALKIRYERKSINYEGMLSLAAAIMWWRRIDSLI